MTDEAASVVLKVDATDVPRAATSLADLTKAGAAAEQQTKKLGSTSAATAAEIDKFNQKVIAAATAQHGMSTAQAEALLGIKSAVPATDAATSSMGAHGKSVASTRASYEAFVAVHEILSGRISRLPGTLLVATNAFLGVGKSATLLSAILSPLGLGVLAVTGAVVAGGIAAKQYADQLDALVAISEGVGAKVGLTAQGLVAAAAAGAHAANVSTGAARQQAQTYAATGQIGQQVIGGLIGVTEDFAALTGQKTPAAMKELAGAFTDPAKGAEDLNAKFGFLNATQLQHIETMAKSGDALGAQKELYRELQPYLTDTETHLRLQHDLWHNVATAIGETWANLGKFLTNGAPSEQVLQRAISNIQATLQAGAGGAQTAQLQNELKQYQAELQAITSDAGRAKAAVANIAINQGNAVVNKYDLTGADKQRALTEQLATVEKALANARTYDAAAVAGLTVTQDALTRAIRTYVAPAQKAHDVAVAQAQAAAATTPVQKAAAAAALVRANAEGEVATASQISQKAQDAATTATDRASHSHLGHAQALAREADALATDVTATLEAASAYLKSTTAGEKAEAARKALTQSVKDGLSPAQEAAKIAASQALADAQAIEGLSKKATALADQVKDQAALNARVATGVITSAQASEQLVIENQLRDDNARLARLTGAERATEEEAIKKETAALAGSNAQKRIEQDLSGRDTARDRAAALELEASMIGRTNAERAVALAQLEAEQRLRAQGYDATTATPDEAKAAQQAIDAAASQAKAQVELDQTTADYNATLDHQLALMTQIADQAQVLGDNLSKAFGTAGDALSGLLAAQTNYAAKLAQIDKDRTEAGLKYSKDSAAWNAAIQKADADTTAAKALHDGQVLDSAKNLFGQQSAAYKALSVVQQVYYAEQFAMQAAAVAKDLAHTAVSVANAITRGTADEAAGAAKMFSYLGPFAFPVVAAMVALLAGLGLRGHGGGSAAVVPSAEDIQKAAGTGTVLGSPQVQSDSITRSLDAAAKDQNELLQVNNAMLGALRAIEGNIGSLTAAIAQQLSLSGGAFDTSSLGLGTTKGHFLPGVLGGLLGFLGTGTTTTKSLLDQGISFSPQQLSQLLAGVADQTYQTVETKKKTSFLGITLASSDKTSTTNGQVSDDLNHQIQLVVGSLRDGLVAAAKVLGVDGAKATLDAFNVDLGKLSFKDLDAKGIQDELTAAFSKLGDQMAQAIAPDLAHFQQAGEGMMATLTRLANEVEVTDQVFAQLGINFTELGVNGLDARDQLVKLAGGLDDFTSAASAYVQAFLTEQQQLVPIAAAVTKGMTALGLSGVTTKTQFEAVVSSIDLTTDGGRQLYTQLMQLAPAFAKVADAAEQLSNQRRDMEITYLQATGDALGATALQREKEVAALDASLRPLQLAIYAAQDLAAANDNLAQAQANLLQLQQQAADAAAQAQIKALQGVASAAQQTAQDTASAAQAAAQDVQTATQALTQAYDQQVTALQGTADQFSGFAASLKQFRDSLSQGAGSGLSIAQQYAAAKAQFQSTARSAKAGDPTAIGNLQSVSQAFLTISQRASSSSLGYQRDIAAVRTAVNEASATARAQVDIAHRQLDALKAQVSGLIQVNQSVLSVTDAIAALHSAVDKQTTAQAAADAAQAVYLQASAAAQAAQLAYEQQQASQQAAALQAQIAAAQAAVQAAQNQVGNAKTEVTNNQPTPTGAGGGLVLHDAAGNALTFKVGVPNSAAYYQGSEQAAKRSAAVSGAYDNDTSFWGRFFDNNADLQARYASLVAGGMTSGHVSTQSTGGEASWQWVRDLYKAGQFGDRALYAGGGLVLGPGSGTSDSIDASLSNGEYVMRAGVVAQPGVRQLLDMLNYGGGVGNDNSSAGELRALRQEVAQLREYLKSAGIAIATHTAKDAKESQKIRFLLERLSLNGDALQVEVVNTADAPVPTQKVA